ncbi:MAG TPA: hydroxyacid dehydrogenase [Streptosporangiaceae bacterium]|nr:hydroxyacid dehydrogenase [Streptosporangiaceae bacterium]
MVYDLPAKEAGMRVLIPQPLPHLPGIAGSLGREHEIVSAPGTSEAELAEAVATADAFVATAMDVSRKVLQAGRRLLVVGTPQVGFDRIDVAGATDEGIPVISSAGVSPDSVAEFTLGLMISLARRIARSDRDLRRTGWSTRRNYAEPDAQLGIELGGRCLGIVGVGHIGASLAAKCQAAFGCRVLGYDPFISSEQMAPLGIEKRESLLDLAREADFLTLHVPLTSQTHHLVDATVLAAMKPSAFVVNVARGGVLDEAALAGALRDGGLAGAALDVFESEPLPAGHPLLERDDVILTPHIAGVTHESNERRSAAFVARLTDVLAGRKPPGLANPAVWEAYEERRRRLGL